MGSLSNQNSSDLILANLTAAVKNKQALKQHEQIIEQHFGFNIPQVSKKNMRDIRTKLLQGNAAIIQHSVHPEDKAFFQQLSLPTALTEQECNIFQILIKSFTLKHATNAIEAIIESGKILPPRTVALSGKNNALHTSSKQGVDRSIYFTFGIGNHHPPKFLSQASHIITVDLNKMGQQEPVVPERLWVSTHLSEYARKKQCSSQLGDVEFSMRHFTNKRKIYRFAYKTGQTLEWPIHYEEEIFSGQDVSPGLALRFIYMLRLLGGKHNKLVKKLYDISHDTTACFPLLEKLVSIIMPGWIYPEAKIIGELNIQRDYITISDLPQPNITFSTINQNTVAHAIQRNDYNLLVILLKKNYLKYCQNNSYAIYKEVFQSVKDNSLRLKFLALLVEHGLNPRERNGLRGDTALHVAVQKGTCTDLDYLLSTPIPDKTEPLISYLSTPNIECRKSDSTYLDLVDMACGLDKTGSMLEVLKKHGADFNNGYEYLKTAIAPNHRDHAFDDALTQSNHKAVFFLQAEGVIANTEEPWNKTPLMLACRLGNLDIIQCLIEKMGANIHTPLKIWKHHFLLGSIHNDPSNGMTALHFAAQCGDKAVVTYLLNKGANPNASTLDGRKPVDFLTKNDPELTALLQPPGDSSLPQIPMQLVQKMDMPKQKVAVMLIGNRRGKPYVVLAKRKSNSQYYCFPGGSADFSDLTLEDAAIRELFEETGVNVKNIPDATIKTIGTFNGFLNPKHETTTLFMMHVGEHPITVHACDDLAEAVCVDLDTLFIDFNQNTANSMKYKDIRIWGSNALAIKYYLLQKQKNLSAEQLEAIQQQLHIEAQGYAMIADLVRKNKDKIYPTAEVWQHLISLLEQYALYSSYKGHPTAQTLSLLMLKANPIQGMELLVRHGLKINSYKERGQFSAYFGECYGGPLVYSIAMMQSKVFRHLLNIGATLSDFEENQILLQMAAKTGNIKILKFLLEQGLDPNRSPDYESRAGSFLLKPVTAIAITSLQLNLLQYLISDGRVFLNRERWPETGQTVLMTAIEHGVNEAAMELLATCRLNLNLKAKSDNNEWNNVTALELANRIGLMDDVIAVIHFLNTYKNMNEVFIQFDLPKMDGFVHTVDKKGQPIIHCFAKDKAKINRLLTLGGPSKIAETTAGYFIPLGKAQLEQLVGVPVAEFLLKYTKESIFWEIRNRHYYRLQKHLIENSLTKIDIHSIDSRNQFKKLQKRDYYRQLMRENTSLREFVIEIDGANQQAMKWLIDTLSGHDTIETITLRCKNAGSIHSWQPALHCLATIKKLQHIHCDHLPAPYLDDLFHFLATQKISDSLSLTLSGKYSPQEYAAIIKILDNLQWRHDIHFANAPADIQADIERIILNYQVQYCSTLSKSFSIKYDELMKAGLQCLTLSLEKPIKNKVFFNYVLCKSAIQSLVKPKHLVISSDFAPDFLHKICHFISSSSCFKSISITSRREENAYQQIIEALAESPSPLKHVNLRFASLNQDATIALSKIFAKNSIRKLQLEYATFKVSDNQIMQTLSSAISKNTALEALNIKGCYFNNEQIHQDFVLQIYKNTSLLYFQFSEEKIPKELLHKEPEAATENTQEIELREKAVPLEPEDLLHTATKILQGHGKAGQSIIEAMARLHYGKNQWNPYWVNSGKKLDAIIAAIIALPNDANIESLIDDPNSQLYAALNIQRLAPITFFGRFGINQAKTLMHVTESVRCDIRPGCC